MKHIILRALIVSFFFSQILFSKNVIAQTERQISHYVKKINYNGISVDIVIDDPGNNSPDVILAYHGTVTKDSKILEAAETAVDKVKSITDRKNMLIIGVAYPEEGLLMGDNMKESEAALLWVKNKANEELKISVQKIFLVGHSQGGYIVTRLNTMHETDGVIASAPGPLNMVLRCKLEEAGKASKSEAGKASKSEVCDLFKTIYGPVQENPEPYMERSLLSFTSNYKSDILFVQGMQDSKIQLTSWPIFKEKLSNCNTCKEVVIIELDGYGHPALFQSDKAKKAYNEFIDR